MTTDRPPSTDALREAVATITGAAASAPAGAPGTGPESANVVDRIVASAQRLGVELDATEAERWISAIRAEAAGGDISVDVSTGAYGHRVTMLDYSPEDLARFRAIGAIVGFTDRPPDVLTALSISGSAAQGKIQRFPGDCDFFERINIRAATRADAGRILGELIREKALATLSGPGYRLWEVKWGTHTRPVTYHGSPMKAGSPMSWTREEVVAGQLEVTDADDTSRVIHWSDNELAPGWCKLDWVVADHIRGSIANASNVLDPTWEAPDGSISPLDGFLDPYYQEVYLEADSIPLFSRLVKQLGPDSVDEYVDQLEHEVWKYTVEDPNFGKAARRMYNVFRLTGRYAEAAYLRELFDEPVTALYQVAALVRTLEDAASSGDAFQAETMVAQTDQLIMAAISALDGPDEAEMVSQLLRLRDDLRSRVDKTERTADVDVVRENAMRSVNAYFERMLRSVPEIGAYMDDLAERRP
jgi:hypothetical protein